MKLTIHEARIDIEGASEKLRHVDKSVLMGMVAGVCTKLWDDAVGLETMIPHDDGRLVDLFFSLVSDSHIEFSSFVIEAPEPVVNGPERSRPPSRAWKVEGILEELRKAGSPEHLLDDAVHDACSETATAVNNDGMRAQVEFLLGEGWKPEDILFRAKPDSEE